jgi:RNA polymerase sigma factor (sigma-70 family)
MTTAPVATDEELAARVGDGDAAAFGELYERYFDGAYDFTMRIVRDSDVAADVVQGTFTRAWETLRANEPPRRFKAWLYTVARNRAIDQIRDRRRTVSLIDGERDDEDGRPVTPQAALIDADRLGNPVDAVRDAEVAELVWAAASSLTPDEYSLLDMHLRQQLTPEEMAETLEIRSGTLYTRLSRLRDSVEESLAAELLKRRGRDDCPDLDALIAELEDGALDRAARRRILRHANNCDICSENRRRFVTAAELLPALAPIPATAGLKSDVWNQLPVPETQPAAEPPSRGGPSGASSALPVSLPILGGGLAATAAAIVAAVVLLGGSGDQSPATEGSPAPQVNGSQPSAAASPVLAGAPASSTATATSPPATPAPIPAALDDPVPPGKVLVFEHKGAYYLPVGATLFPAHPPNCAYEHMHGPPMRALFPDSDGTYEELAEFEAECGFGTPDGTLYLVDEPS